MAKDQFPQSGYRAAGASDTGRRRPTNEDAYGFKLEQDGSGGTFVVCDGMGGAAGGEIASHLAVQAMLSALGPGSLSAAGLQVAVSAANSSVYSKAERDPELEGMGTTLVAFVARGARAWVAHAGDSRCYRLRDGSLDRLTQDHSLVDEQVRLGQMTRAEAAVSPLRNVITRAVGTAEKVDADISAIDVLAGDLYLLASDGLTREISDARIAEILRGPVDRGPWDLDQLCSALVQAANSAGGSDNITCLLVGASIDRQ